MIRKLCVAGLCVLAGVALLCSQAPTIAQPKDEVAKLKKTIAERDKTIAGLQAQNQKLKQDADANKKKVAHADKLQRDLDAANQSLKDKDVQIAALRDKSPKSTAELSTENIRLRRNIRDLEAVKKAPFVHTVILKLKKTDDDKVKAIADEAGKTLAKIEGVRGVWVGKPAEDGTPELAQKGYHLGVVVLLDDASALKKFLDDPLHMQFNDKMGSLWEPPVVYDIQRDLEEPKKSEAK